jgi:hypothetical protein
VYYLLPRQIGWFSYICYLFMPGTKFTFFALCMLLPVLLAAQDDPRAQPPWSGFGVEVNPFVGKVFKHEDKFKLPIPLISTGIDVNLKLHSFGRKAWEECCKYPTLGIAITYTNYGIDSIYGRCIGVSPNIEFRLINTTYLEWTLRVGDGIGFVSRHFSRANPIDTINGAIGSTINDFAYFSTDLRLHINKHWDVQLGAHFTHISDASYNKPNLGVNLYGGHAGITYFPVTSRPVCIRRKGEIPKNRWLAQVRLSMAFVSAEAPGGPLYPVYLASGYVSRRLKGKYKPFAGIDYSYHSDVYAFLKNNEVYPGDEKQHSWKSAIFFGNEFLLGRVGVILQVGVYIKQAYLVQDAYYEKIGGHYYLVQKEHGPVKEMFISAMLKTHKTVAELGEIGIGFGF